MRTRRKQPAQPGGSPSGFVRWEILGFCALSAVILAAAATAIHAQSGNDSALQSPGNGDSSPSFSEDPVPKAHPVDRYLEIWKNSPFQREATAPIKIMQKSFARDYAVLGMIQYGDEPVVTLINKKTRQTVRVTREGKDGFQLLEVDKGEGARDLQVTVSKDGEIGELTFDDTFLNTPAVVPRQTANPAQQKRKLTSPNGRVIPPGSPRPNITPPNKTGAVGSSASTNAPVPSKPMPPKTTQVNAQGTAASVNTADLDTGPTVSSRRRVVLPKKN